MLPAVVAAPVACTLPARMVADPVPLAASVTLGPVAGPGVPAAGSATQWRGRGSGLRAIPVLLPVTRATLRAFGPAIAAAAAILLPQHTAILPPAPSMRESGLGQTGPAGKPPRLKGGRPLPTPVPRRVPPRISKNPRQHDPPNRGAGCARRRTCPGKEVTCLGGRLPRPAARRRRGAAFSPAYGAGSGRRARSAPIGSRTPPAFACTSKLGCRNTLPIRGCTPLQPRAPTCRRAGTARRGRWGAALPPLPQAPLETSVAPRPSHGPAVCACGGACAPFRACHADAADPRLDRPGHHLGHPPPKRKLQRRRGPWAFRKEAL